MSAKSSKQRVRDITPEPAVNPTETTGTDEAQTNKLSKRSNEVDTGRPDGTTLKKKVSTHKAHDEPGSSVPQKTKEQKPLAKRVSRNKLEKSATQLSKSPGSSSPKLNQRKTTKQAQEPTTRVDTLKQRSSRAVNETAKNSISREPSNESTPTVRVQEVESEFSANESAFTSIYSQSSIYSDDIRMSTNQEQSRITMFGGPRMTTMMRDEIDDLEEMSVDELSLLKEDDENEVEPLEKQASVSSVTKSAKKESKASVPSLTKLAKQESTKSLVSEKSQSKLLSKRSSTPSPRKLSTVRSRL